VNILFEVSRRVAEVLDFQHWDVDILEAHHRNKVDAPSGTALRLGEMIAAAQDSDFDERKRYPYVNRRKTGDIGFSVVRAGDVIGEHTVFFTADDERLEFTHRASNRRIFARGALTAASWLGDRPAGLYSMADVLGFTS
jgi:dihydrodipicolinate reductase